MTAAQIVSLLYGNSKISNYSGNVVTAFITTPIILSNTDPFLLANTHAYAQWRDNKLTDYPTRIEQLTTTVAEPQRLLISERLSLRRACAKANFAVYESKRPMNKSDIIALGQQLGLTRLDRNLHANSGGISTLRVASTEKQGEYIPYTNQMLNWHTDGYYNSPENAIRAFILHCTSPAASGGETRLLDHEIAYLLLRNQNPEYIRALTHPMAMSIPENRDGSTLIREARTGPVISCSDDGYLQFRYTARTRSIQWKKDPLLSEAQATLTKIIANQAYMFQHILQENQGIICNNLLHSRTAFIDSSKQCRLVYRARYYDRVQSKRAQNAVNH